MVKGWEFKLFWNDVVRCKSAWHFAPSYFLAASKVFTKRRESHLTPYDVRSLGKGLDGTPLPYEKPPFFFLREQGDGGAKSGVVRVLL